MLNTGGSQSSDLANIPTNALQRVEVLRDSASAQYGSDAIAGVINIISPNDQRVLLLQQKGAADPWVHRETFFGSAEYQVQIASQKSLKEGC